MSSIRVQVGFVSASQRAILAGEEVVFLVGLNNDVASAFFTGELELATDIASESILAQLVEGVSSNERIRDGIPELDRRRGVTFVRCIFDDPGEVALRIRLSATDPDEPWKNEHLGSLDLPTIVIKASLKIDPEVAVRPSAFDDSQIYALSITSEHDNYTLAGGWQEFPNQSVASLPLTEIQLDELLASQLERLNNESIAYERLFNPQEVDHQSEAKILAARQAQVGRIARIGWELYDQVLLRDLLPDDSHSRARLLQEIAGLSPRTRIRIRGNRLALPWNVIYDKEPPEPHLFEAKHLEGFWGYRFRIYEAASTPDVSFRKLPTPARRLCAWIDPSPGGSPERPSAVLDEIAEAHRLAMLELGINGTACDTRVIPQDPRQLKDPDFDAKARLAEVIANSGCPNLIYFFCHGHRAKLRLRGLDPTPAALVLTAANRANDLGQHDLKDWRRRWRHIRSLEPIVFLNCCESAGLDPFSIGNLATSFISQLHARAVVGCHWMVPGRFAHEFGQKLLTEILRDQPPCLGDALYEARRSLLETFNSFGLVYSVTGDPQVRVEASRR